MHMLNEETPSRLETAEARKVQTLRDGVVVQSIVEDKLHPFTPGLSTSCVQLFAFPSEACGEVPQNSTRQ